MSRERVFSLPINPKSDEEFVKNIFIPFLQKHKKYIADLYFTCRMPPFTQDAMGDIFVSDTRDLTYQALTISEKTGIPLSATFNNIYVRPSQKNLDIFIDFFKPLYYKGIRTVTLPHTMWVSSGQIQKEFPELFIKNTILREVTRPNEIVSLAKAGFHYINLDRDLMRDRDSLERIIEAKEYCASIGKPVKLSLLANETCWGGCPIMVEHYHFNNTRTSDDPQFFNDPISRNSCSKWDVEDPSWSLKAANLPPWKKDWDEFLDLGVDVFKMHGREAMTRLKESMDIIEKWANDDEILFSDFNNFVDDIDSKEKPFEIWRDKIKNCKFDCWKCNYCDSVVESHLKKQHRLLHPLVEVALESFNKSANLDSNFKHSRFNIDGLSSNRVRHMLNYICSFKDTKYLEVGVYHGSTFCAAIQNNQIKAYAVDTWEEKKLQPFVDGKLSFKSNCSVDVFEKNLKNYLGSNEVKVINKKAEAIDSSDVQDKVNVIFYDGSHELQDQKKVLTNLLDVTDSTFLLLVDDANFEGVIDASEQFVKENNLTVLFERKLLNDIEDDTMWWNGLHMLVLQK